MTTAVTDNAETDWNNALRKLIRHYRNEPSTLDDKGSIYRLLVMVILAAQSSDNSVNKATVDFFKKYPDLRSLSKATAEQITPFLSSIRFHRKKIAWIMQIAHQLKDDSNIPLTMKELTALPGVGRKSANMIMRSSGAKAEGIMVDLHVLRVAGRLGISDSADASQVEKDLMQILRPALWNESGSALSTLGRLVCRPRNPLHSECILNDVCEYCRKHRPVNPPK